MSNVAPIPPQYGTLTPYLVLSGCARAIEFYKNVFGAEEVMRMAGPNDSIGHAELRFGDRILMLADGVAEWPATSALIAVYVADCDAVFARAVAAGAEVVQPLEDKFYGDRAATVRDPFGQRWSIMTHKEDVPPEEMQRRVAKLMGG
jgi:PhnB protein